MSEWTTCGLCGRVIYIAHADLHGNCDQHGTPTNGESLGEPDYIVTEDGVTAVQPVKVDVGRVLPARR